MYELFMKRGGEGGLRIEIRRHKTLMSLKVYA
jgi:hypothetical protein